MQQSGWASLPHEILALVFAHAASQHCPLPLLLAPSRVCRAWAAAYRDDGTWRALQHALWPEALTQRAVATSLMWRERVAACALALPLLDVHGALGATEVPLEALFDRSARHRRESVSVCAGGHVCALAAGRLAVAHLGALDAVATGLTTTTSVLHSTCADRLSHVALTEWSGCSVVVSVCAPRPGRATSVLELTQLSCCEAGWHAGTPAALACHAGTPAARFEETGEVTAVAVAAVPDTTPGGGGLLLAYAVRRAGVALLRARLLRAPDGEEGASMRSAWTHELRLVKAVATTLCSEQGGASLLVGTDGGVLMRWAPGSGSGGADCVRLRTVSKARLVTPTPGGGVLALGDTSAGGASVVSLPRSEAAAFGAALAERLVVPLLPSARPLHAAAASLSALAVATAAGDIELFHARSGRMLGRVLTSDGGGPYRRMQLAPAVAHGGAQMGLISVAHNSLGVRVLLHGPHEGDAAAAGLESGAEEASAPLPTLVRVAPWAEHVLPLALEHV